MQDTLFRLDGKTALVTGGCYGIGFAMATGLARAGARIAFNGVRPESVARGKEAYSQAGIDALGLVCDVTDERAVGQMVEGIEARLGPIDILVNNAGITRRAPVDALDTGDFRRVVDVDLVAPFIVAKAVLPGMVRRGGGKIINVCSVTSELGRETLAAYASAKGGLKMLTKTITSEYAGQNIQCNGIGPGYIDTPHVAALKDPLPDGGVNPFDRFIVNRTPAGRWGAPEDLIGPTVFLASDASNFVNGQILYVDGGLLAYPDRPE